MITNMTDQEYRDSEAVNFSTLKHMLKSPAHFKAAWDARGDAEEPTTAMLIGSYVHMAILEPERFAQGPYVVRPAGMKFTTTEGKAWKAQQTVPVLDYSQDQAIKGMRDQVLNRPALRAMLSDGHAEGAHVWEDKGFALKGRTDYVTSNGILIDVKTTNEIDPARFQSKVNQFHYDMQLAMYTAALASEGVQVEKVYILAIESVAPYDVILFDVDQEVLAFGDRKYLKALARLAECRDTGIYPGIAGDAGVMPLTLSRWAASTMDTDDAVDLFIKNLQKGV